MRDKATVAFLVVWLVTTLGSLAFTGFLIYAFCHFVMKYW